MPLNIANQAAQGLNDYKMEMARAAAGLLMDSNPVDSLSRQNSGVAAQQTIADIVIGGTIATGNIFTITVVVTTPIGNTVSRAITYTAVAGETIATAAQRLAAAVNAEDLINDYVEATSTATAVRLEVRTNRKVDAVTCSGQAAATITPTPAIVTPSDPTQVRWGFFVAQYPEFGDNQAGAVTTNVNATILGINRMYHVEDREHPYDPTREFGTQAYKTLLILRKARVWVPVFGTVNRHQAAAYINTTGQPCASGTANSTNVPGAVFIRPSGSDGLAGLELNLP